MAYIDRREQYEKLNRQLEEQARAAFLEKAQLDTDRRQREADERGRNSFQFTQADEAQAFKDRQFNERWKLDRAKEAADAAREAKYSAFLENQKRENEAFAQKPMFSKLLEGNAFANKQASEHSEFLKKAELERKAFETKAEAEKKALSEKQAYEKKAFGDKQFSETTAREKMIADQKAAAEALAKHQSAQNQLAAMAGKQADTKGPEAKPSPTPENIPYSTGMGQGKNWNAAWANSANQARDQSRQHAARQAELTAQQEAAQKAGQFEQAKMADLQKQLDAKQYERGLAISVANKEHLIRGASEDHKKYLGDAELARREANALAKAIEDQQKIIDAEKAKPPIEKPAEKPLDKPIEKPLEKPIANPGTNPGTQSIDELQAAAEKEAADALKRLNDDLQARRIDDTSFINESDKIQRELEAQLQAIEEHGILMGEIMEENQRIIDRAARAAAEENQPEQPPTGAPASPATKPPEKAPTPPAPKPPEKPLEAHKAPENGKPNFPSRKPAPPSHEDSPEIPKPAGATKAPEKPPVAPPPTAPTAGDTKYPNFAARAGALKAPNQDSKAPPIAEPPKPEQPKPQAPTAGDTKYPNFASRANDLKAPTPEQPKPQAPTSEPPKPEQPKPEPEAPKADKPKDPGMAPKVDKPIIAPPTIQGESNNFNSSAAWKEQCDQMNRLRGAIASNNATVQNELQSKLAEHAQNEKNNARLATERGDLEKAATHDAQARACQAAKEGDMRRAQAAENEAKNGRLNGRLRAGNNPKGFGPDEKEAGNHTHVLKPDSAKPKHPGLTPGSDGPSGPTPISGRRKPEPEPEPEEPKKPPPPPPPPPPEPEGPCM